MSVSFSDDLDFPAHPEDGKVKDEELLAAYLSGREAGEAIAEKKMGEEVAKLRMTVGDLTRKLMENQLL